MATSRREQADADAYEARRHATSLLLGEDEALRDPRRRLNRVLVGSTLVAVLVLAAFGVVGLLGGGRGPALPQQGAVVVKGTGDRYVVVDGRVHPALNLASALLVGGGELTEVRARALDALPRGLPVGIPGAPDALPPRERLATGDWTVCATPSASASVPPEVVVAAGLPLAPSDGGETDAVLVGQPDGTQWLVTGTARHRLGPGVAAVLAPGRTDVDLPPEVLATVPEAAALEAPVVDGDGEVPAVALPLSARVGDLLRVRLAAGQEVYYVVQRDGLSAVTEFAALLEGGRLFDTSADAIAAVPQVDPGGLVRPGWPERRVEVADLQRGQALCVAHTPGAAPGDAAWAVRVSTPPSAPTADGSTPVTARGGDLPGPVTEVLVGRGSGALVAAAGSGGQDATFTLVTDAGQRYAVPSAEAVQRLRYDPATAPRLPRAFVELLPAGPVLDPTAAAVEATGQG